LRSDAARGHWHFLASDVQKYIEIARLVEANRWAGSWLRLLKGFAGDFHREWLRVFVVRQNSRSPVNLPQRRFIALGAVNQFEHVIAIEANNAGRVHKLGFEFL
jgi:hypothetical protein